MSDWLRERDGGEAANQAANEDDVSANYLRGSRSPPGIATHLLRSSAPSTPLASPALMPPHPPSPAKTVCSAKKRWLRQAISEEPHQESPVVNGMSSVAPPEPAAMETV